MKKFYPLSILLFFVYSLKAQNPTSVFTSSDCNSVRTFDSTDEGFSSPSIYSADDNVSFFWNSTSGALIESSGSTVREGSLISPVFINNVSGQTVVGFTYSAPAGTEYRIRVISGLIGSQLEILATTANGPEWDPLPSTSGSLCLLLVDADLTVAQGLRYEFSFRANQLSDILFDNFSINAATAPLPVIFLGFVARKNDNGSIRLLWDVGEEINVNSYTVERSSDGNDFTSIGSVAASGKSTYSLEDNQVIETQTLYYRVKNMDIDGQFKYTPVIKIAGKKFSGHIQLYPMPASDYVYIQHVKAPSKVCINLYTLDGKMVKQIMAIPDTYQTLLNIDDLKSGIYIVKYNDGTGIIQSAKLIKP